MKTFKLSKPAIIMAFNMPDLTHKQEAIKVAAIAALPAKQVIGCWDGAIEVSYVFTPHSAHDVFQLMQLARAYKQEAVLYLDTYRNGLLIAADVYEEFYLMYREGRSTHAIAKALKIDVKQWVTISSKQALADTCYTHDPSTELYYSLV